MYPLGDEDRRRGSHCPVLMISSEHWNLTKHQAPFRKDFKQNTIQKLSKSSEDSPLVDPHSHRHPLAVTVLDSDHLNYCDMVYLSSPLLMTRTNYLGKTNPYTFSVAKDHLILRFFHASASSSSIPPADLSSSSSITLPSSSDQDQQETSPLHHEPSPAVLKSASSHHPSPHSVVHPEEHVDVERLFRYCHLPRHNPPASLSSDPRWSSSRVEPIPDDVVQYLETSLVDESSLPHCYDDEYFNKINQMP
jgi:hypothetical protein